MSRRTKKNQERQKNKRGGRRSDGVHSQNIAAYEILERRAYDEEKRRADNDGKNEPLPQNPPQFTPQETNEKEKQEFEMKEKQQLSAVERYNAFIRDFFNAEEENFLGSLSKFNDKIKGNASIENYDTPPFVLYLKCGKTTKEPIIFVTNNNNIICKFKLKKEQVEKEQVKIFIQNDLWKSWKKFISEEKKWEDTAAVIPYSNVSEFFSKCSGASAQTSEKSSGMVDRLRQLMWVKGGLVKKNKSKKTRRSHKPKTSSASHNPNKLRK